jgi:hypothetical protein
MPFQERWAAQDPNYRILPVYPEQSRIAVQQHVPPEYRTINAAFWSQRVEQVVPAVLAQAGLTFTNPRCFITYRQREAPALALQLFDALSHAGFDSFLDYLRIEPGVDFQARLTQELGDKSCVVVLESHGILTSEWTLYEINRAKTMRIGLMALHLPGSPAVPGIDGDARYNVHPEHVTELTPEGTTTPHAELSQESLSRVVSWIRSQHDRQLLRRNAMLQTSMRNALRLAGLSDQQQYFDAAGVLHVLQTGGDGRGYMIWLPVRPPETADFYQAHGTCQQARPGTQGVLIGLSSHMDGTRRAIHTWLGERTDIVTVDEEDMASAALRMGGGELL